MLRLTFLVRLNGDCTGNKIDEKVEKIPSLIVDHPPPAPPPPRLLFTFPDHSNFPDLEMSYFFRMDNLQPVAVAKAGIQQIVFLKKLGKVENH